MRLLSSGTRLSLLVSKGGVLVGDFADIDKNNKTRQKSELKQ